MLEIIILLYSSVLLWFCARNAKKLLKVKIKKKTLKTLKYNILNACEWNVLFSLQNTKIQIGLVYVNVYYYYQLCTHNRTTKHLSFDRFAKQKFGIVNTKIKRY